MRVVKCENGHFFDLEKGTVCPRCGSDEYTLTGVKPEAPVAMDKKAEKAKKKADKEAAKVAEKEHKQMMKAMKKGGYYQEPHPMYTMPNTMTGVVNSMTGEEVKYNMGPTGDFVDYRNATRQGVSIQPTDIKTEKLGDYAQDIKPEQSGIYNPYENVEQTGKYTADVHTEQLGESYIQPVAEPIVNNVQEQQIDLSDVKTVYYEDFEDEEEETPVDAVVGWLVCVEGEDKGSHYTLKAGVNNLGRAVDMDVSIRSDVGISRDRHSILVYEPESREFFIQPGIGRGMTYLNDNVVLGSQKINERDCIRMGKTKLVFVSLCSPEFGWE